MKTPAALFFLPPIHKTVTDGNRNLKTLAPCCCHRPKLFSATAVPNSAAPSLLPLPCFAKPRKLSTSSSSSSASLFMVWSSTPSGCRLPSSRISPCLAGCRPSKGAYRFRAMRRINHVNTCHHNELYYVQSGDIAKLPLLCHYPVKFYNIDSVI
ncbi:hypothetical protein Ahy_A10g049162 [Arachis hypogaea]|uniref:Uncharacterized protein n=1 Tax=Arachis hypogaea TaxID=3818 RepID=A0A445B6N0_ARAHY|nr:hypothetical protein Ahy_A10g049162 [Arachis hypogaea]